MPQYISSDDDNLDVPKRNCKVLSLSEKVEVLDLIKKKILFADVATIYSIIRYFERDCI